MKKQSWRPNWKNEAAYPDDKKTSGEQFAWEFLRRNPEYEKDYNKFINFTYDSTCEPRDLDYYKAEASKKLAYQWGIKEMVDPSKSEPENLMFLKGGIVSYSPGISDYDSDHGCNPEYKDMFTEEWTLSPRGRLGEVLLKFDLNIPLNQQLETAKKRLGELQKTFEDEFNIKDNKKRSRKDIYPEYLRILDGIEAKADDEEITRIICSSSQQGTADASYSLNQLAKKKFGDNLDAANLIMTSTYRDIHLTKPSK